jgi:two-component system, chemotaxis family, protein-glutamate methylesterase/glutaminase
VEPRRIIAIGCSAGGVETLSRLVAELPIELPAALCIVVHFPAGSISALPRILERSGRLPARHARDGDVLEAGHIYVAPPDWHLLVVGPVLHLSHDPAENSHRPAIDVMFRSVAATWDGRAIGVILSGTGDDGTAGLAVLRAAGAIAVVQDPVEAIFSAMPRSALENVDVDHCVPVRDMGPLLDELAAAPARTSGRPQAVEGGAEDPVQTAPGSAPFAGGSGLTCPDCGGALWEIQEGNVLRFRCRVGHTFSPDSLFDQQSEALESALWGAVRALEERAALAQRMAARFRVRGHEQVARRFDDRARNATERAGVIQRALVSESESNPGAANVVSADRA